MIWASRLLPVALAVAVAASPSASSRTARGAEPPVPATVPATSPSLDQSSPKSLLRSFYASRGEVDEATLRSLLHATTPLEQKILDSLVQVELANARLRTAERNAFGGTPTTGPAGGAAAGPFDVGGVTDLETLTEKIDGDRATVSSPMDPAVAMEFVRVDGKWKLPIAAQLGGAAALDPAIAETLGASTRAQVELIDSVAADVRAGKFAGSEQVRQELSRRFAERLASATRPASQSATQPAAGT